MSTFHFRHAIAWRKLAAAVACVTSVIAAGPSAYAAPSTFSGSCTLDHVDASGDSVWRLAASSMPGGTYRVSFVWPTNEVFYGYAYRADNYVVYYTDYSGDRMSGKTLVSRAERRKGSVISETATYTCG